MIASPARYGLLAALVLGGLAVLAAQGTRLGLLPALLLLPLVAWPCWLGLAYQAAIRKAQARSLLQEGEAPWWGPLLGGAAWRQVLAAIPVSLLAAWSVGWTLIAQGWAGLGWVAATGAVLYPVAGSLSQHTRALKPYARLRPVMRTAPVITAALLTGVWLLLGGLVALGEETLAERIAAEPHYEGASALLAWAVDATGVVNGARVWGLALAEGRVGLVATLWRVAAGFGQFWLIAGVFAGLLLPRGEGRRILRATDADEPPPAGPARAASAAFLLTLLAVALVSLLARAEAWASARQRPATMAEMPGLVEPDDPSGAPSLPGAIEAAPVMIPPGLPSPTAVREAVEAERLGDLACPEGTFAGLVALDDGLRVLLASQRARIEGAARAGFDAMRANVPAYLDWYYSLPAEYARTGHLLVGDAGGYLEARFRGALEAGDPLGPLRLAAGELDGNPARIAEWRQAREALLGACADASLPADDLALVATMTAPAAILTEGPAIESLDLRARLGRASLAGVGGGLAGALIGKTMAKLVLKDAFGLAADALAKLAVGKATGWFGGVLAGAGGGALGGSVVPGVGTTIGAVVGGVVGGAATWVATDYALLALDEAASRDDFEAQILAALEEAEAEFLAALSPPS